MIAPFFFIGLGLLLELLAIQGVGTKFQGLPFALLAVYLLIT